MPTVADLKKNGPDVLGDEVLVFYGRNPPGYAVYRTAQRVLIQFADDSDLAAHQRKTMAPLNPLRGEINGLVDGWRMGSDWFRCKAERYDRRVGDALVVALEEDGVDGAKSILEGVKNDILAERVGRARFEYLICAFFIGLLVSIAIWAGTTRRPPDPAMDLWLAGAAGTIGAFFSIALDIHRRTMLPDLQRVANLLDAGLRMLIGLIAAIVLMALVRSKAVTFGIGGAKLEEAAWLYVLIVGFIGGFVERLVPDLLASAKVEGNLVESKKEEKEKGSAEQPERAGERQPASVVTLQTVGAKEKPQPDPVPEQADTDNCLCDIDKQDADATPDDQLPRASGGVEAKAA